MTAATAEEFAPSIPPALLVQERQIRSLTSSLRMRVLVLLGIAILIAIALGAIQLLVAKSHHEEHDAEEDAVALRRAIEVRSGDHVGEMRALIALTTTLPRLEAMYRAGDRQALLRATAPVLEQARAHSRISHLSFIRPDGTVLLRVHAPGEHGDRVDHFVLQRAQQTRGPAWGYVQGPDGSVALRTNAPWVVNGELLGHLEMGIALEDLLSGIQRVLDAEFIVTLDKARLEQRQWESAQAGKPQAARWDAFPARVVLSQTVQRIPAQLEEFLSGLGATSADGLLRVRENGRILHASEMPLRDARGETVGHLLMFKDRTDEVGHSLDSVLASTGQRAIGGALMMLFLWIVLGRVQRDLAEGTNRLGAAQRVLAREQQERQRAEQELALQQERNEFLEARNRMVEELAEAKLTAEDALRRSEEVAAKLVEAQSELMASAREAGRAEIATNVLHNVGNVLNSVNISAGVIGSALRNSRLSGLTRAMQLVTAHQGDLGNYLTRHEKGRMLPAYLAAAVEALDKERQTMLEELSRLTKSIDHIKDIVATQQAHAAARNVIEPVQPSELAEEALRMQGTALARHQVAVVREYEDLPVLPLDRGRVLQILVNLISNAKTAMAGAAAGRPARLTLGIRRMDGRLQFMVRDEGEGILPENLTRIFSHGFTTRKTGHGFGLHSSALVARELGGTLSAASEGAGRGALFTLDLPIGPSGAQEREAALAAN